MLLFYQSVLLLPRSCDLMDNGNEGRSQQARLSINSTNHCPYFSLTSLFHAYFYLEEEEFHRCREKALLKLRKVVSENRWYFQENPKVNAQKVLKDTIQSHKVIILLQLLCPASKHIHKYYDVEPNLAYDGFGFQ
jgi:hypothetical protein